MIWVCCGNHVIDNDFQFSFSFPVSSFIIVPAETPCFRKTHWHAINLKSRPTVTGRMFDQFLQHLTALKPSRGPNSRKPLSPRFSKFCFERIDPGTLQRTNPVFSLSLVTPNSIGNAVLIAMTSSLIKRLCLSYAFYLHKPSCMLIFFFNQLYLLLK